MVHQVVVFDWRDGPRQGIAALWFPNCEVAFDLLAKHVNPDGLDDRLFGLRELATGSCQSILGIISKLGSRDSPVWVPCWEFADRVERQRTDPAINAGFAGARKTPIVVLTPGMIHFAGCWSVHGEAGDGMDWFTVLGIE